MNYAIIVGGGKGKRFSNKIKKQFFKIGSKTIIDLTIQKFSSNPLIDKIVVVLPEKEKINLKSPKIFKIVKGGEERKDSVVNGLQSIIDLINPDDNILIHDAVRPFFSNTLINNIIKELEKDLCVVPGIKIEDTVKEIDNNFYVISTLNRDKLVRIQTPQGLKGALIKDFIKTSKLNKIFTDDASIVEFLGKKVKIIQGEKQNIKITTKEDVMNLLSDYRVGFGYDVHRFAENRKLYLGGIEIPYSYGLEGHSDADVLIHSIIDAILGAAGKSDIGELFPDTNQNFKNIRSTILLEKVFEQIKDEFIINNIDVTVVCEEPKLKTFKLKIKETLANILQIESSRINIKATTTEKLGFTGKKQGIACYSVVSLIKIFTG